MLKFFSIAFILFLALITVPTFIEVGDPDPTPEMDIYLVSNDIHTGIVVPVRNKIFDWESLLNAGEFKERPTEWIEFGWGDRQFYFEMPTWDQFTFRLALDALLLPDPAVMHVEYLQAQPWNYPSSQKIRISFKTYEKLVKYLRDQLVLKDGRPILIPNKGYGDSDNFYEAKGSFSLYRTCNIWTSEMLGEIGLSHPLWSPSKYGLARIWDQYQ